MKNTTKILLLSIIIFLVSFVVACQNKKDTAKELEEKITTLDKAGWEAWKNKNGKWFEENTTINFFSISADGISNKTQVIQSTNNDCDVKSYALSDIQFSTLSKESVLLTYTVEQDATCGGTQLNAKIRVAANYILQNNKWLEAFYMESKME